jgi:hypothetical protein
VRAWLIDASFNLADTGAGGSGQFVNARPGFFVADSSE